MVIVARNHHLLTILDERAKVFDPGTVTSFAQREARANLSILQHVTRALMVCHAIGKREHASN